MARRADGGVLPDGLHAIAGRARARYTTIGDMAYSVIREAILGGVLAPGQHLRQDALALSLGISRIPIRSALFQLESDGLIEFRPHRGAVVSMLTPGQMREVYELRILLETYALRKAIPKMTPERLKRLEALARTLDRAPLKRFLEARVAFYQELYGAAGNPRLVELIERLRSEVGRYWLRRRVVGQEGGRNVHSVLLEHARRGNVEGAVRWLEAHLEEVGSQLAAMVEEAAAEPASEPV